MNQFQSQTLNGKIQTLGFGGEGIMRHEGLVIFVPFTAPGDTVSVEILSAKKNFAHGKLLNIESPSPKRVTPVCPHFGICGGCQFQHLNYSAQLQAKQTFVKDALQRIAKIPISEVPITAADPQWHYRRHIRLKLKKKNQGFEAGYMANDNVTFVPVAHCPIFLPMEAGLFAELQSLLQTLSSEGIEEGSLRVIKVKENKFVLAFHFAHKLPDNWAICENAIGTHWQGIIFQTPHEQTSCGDTTCALEVLGLKLRFSPFGFVQNHPQQSENLYRATLDLLLDQAETILDLYCGVGVTSLLCARAGKKVTGIELHAETVALAQENAMTNGLTAQFLEGKAEKLTKQLLQKERPGAVLCNPPRIGLDPQLIQTLLEEKPQQVLYTSCMPSTLARDLQKLIQGGYHLDHIQAFDLFPQTTHVETLVRLRY